MNSSLFVRTYWLVIAAAFAAVLAMLVLYTPVEKSMGPVQKIFYVHLPVAINTFVAAFAVFIGSIGYLWKRSTRWDDLAAASGNVTVVFCAVVLLTGMTWARSAWGQWWTWSPRLTFSLVLLILYVVYVVLRTAIDSPERRALVSAVYGLFAFLDVPLVYFSVKLMPDMHPSSITLEPAMKLTLLAWFAPVTALMVGLITARYSLNRKERALQQSHMSNQPTRAVISAQIGAIS